MQRDKHLSVMNEYAPTLSVLLLYILGLIGPTLSATAPSVARFMNKMQIPVITPSATLVELADKTKYGSLLRTVPSDDKQSKVRYCAHKKAIIIKRK